MPVSFRKWVGRKLAITKRDPNALSQHLPDGHILVGRVYHRRVGPKEFGSLLQEVRVKQIKPNTSKKEGETFIISPDQFPGSENLKLGQKYLIMASGWREAIAEMSEDQLRAACKVIPPEDFVRRRMTTVSGEVVNIKAGEPEAVWIMLENTRAKIPRLVKVMMDKSQKQAFPVGSKVEGLALPQETHSLGDKRSKDKGYRKQ
ncbi:MAG: hypothetical protein V4568_02530 [Pseudomonadota bacterium]